MNNNMIICTRKDVIWNLEDNCNCFFKCCKLQVQAFMDWTFCQGPPPDAWLHWDLENLKIYVSLWWTGDLSQLYPTSRMMTTGNRWHPRSLPKGSLISPPACFWLDLTGQPLFVHLWAYHILLSLDHFWQICQEHPTKDVPGKTNFRYVLAVRHYCAIWFCIVLFHTKPFCYS